MICAACGHTNREDAKFCTECGTALAAACPACGRHIEPGEKFCAQCGSPLVPAAPASSFASSPETVPASAEKKQLTVLFADVAGSMDLQEQLDPEVWAQIMGRFVAILAEGVRRFGGTVDTFTGDGIMALFGAPVAQEDHARRACHAASPPVDVHLLASQPTLTRGHDRRKRNGLPLRRSSSADWRAGRMRSFSSRLSCPDSSGTRPRG